MLRQSVAVLTTTELLTRLRERGIRNVEIARALNLPESRIAELFAGKRSLKLDEAACLVEAFRLEDAQSVAHDAVPLSNRVAANIKRLREAENLSRPQLAQRCRPSTSPQQIEKLERGERKLSLDWLERIARALNVDPAELIIGSPINAGGMSDEVAREVGRALGIVSLGGRQPNEATVKMLASMLHDLADLFARHPEARHKVDVARPAIDLIARRNEKLNGADRI